MQASPSLQMGKLRPTDGEGLGGDHTAKLGPRAQTQVWLNHLTSSKTSGEYPSTVSLTNAVDKTGTQSKPKSPATLRTWVLLGTSSRWAGGGKAQGDPGVTRMALGAPCSTPRPLQRCPALASSTSPSPGSRNTAPGHLLPRPSPPAPALTVLPPSPGAPGARLWAATTLRRGL